MILIKQIQIFSTAPYPFFFIVLLYIQIQMGNSTASEQASNIEQHTLLGQVSLIHASDQQGKTYEQMVITRILQQQQQFQRWHRQLRKIDDSVTREVLLLPNKTVYQTTGMCGSSGLVKLTYDHYPYVFQVEIENRRKINRYFLETELWYLLYTMVRAGSKFEKYHSKIGDIHPSNILINDDGLVKLISRCSFPREESNFQKLIEDPRRRVFLAPEQLEQHSLERAEYPKNIDPATSQCYSIGLCMLAAGTLEDIDSIYSWGSDQKIQRGKVNYFIKLLGEKYSSFLQSTVIGLLAENPLQRKKCGEIYTSLYEYQDKILDLESFMPNNSRLIPYQPQAVNSVQIHPIHNPQRQVQHDQYHPIYSRANSTNLYYQGVPVGDPIQSKYTRYVPTSPVHNQNIPSFRHSQGQFPNQQLYANQRNFHPQHSVSYSNFR